MTARTHDGFAFASLISVASFYPPASLNVYTVFAALVANIVGALIPDMDQAGNRLWDLLPGGDKTAKVLRLIFYKHRTVSHSFLGVFLVYYFLSWLLPKILNPSYIYPDVVLTSTMIGYLSHLLADGLTEEGVPLLFPIRINFGFPPIAKMRIVTGGWFEKYIVQPGLAIYIVWFVTSYKDKITELFKLLS